MRSAFHVIVVLLVVASGSRWATGSDARSAAVAVAAAAAVPARAAVPTAAPGAPSAPAPDLAAARKGFTTRLRVRGPAPQAFENVAPPAGVTAVAYASGDLKLKGWLSADARDGRKRPAVVFLHGGFAFGADDWADAAPYAKAGFVLFMPTLRGENGNPGAYESFLGEVDDAIAAGRFVASLPNVDADRVYVAGHSVGAVLTCLTTMLPSPYKGAAALDGYLEMTSWAARSPDAMVPYDRNDPQEILVRHPLRFAGSIHCPVRLYSTNGTRPVSALLAKRAKAVGKDCEVVPVEGDHQSMLAPAVRQSAEWFRQLATQ